MFYDFAITVAANTTEADPTWQVMELTKGAIIWTGVQFPIGCRELTHCQIYHGGHQLYPTNPDGNLASDGYVVPIDDMYELKTAPYTLKAKCWNEDDTYQHIITIYITLLRGEFWLMVIRILKGLQKFLKLVGIRT